ncbi:hypothetical protein P4O66_022921 [Electrophorus voltai]|uniref:Integrase catalytic domain-containing protein n=1 Tax=Electrophorus voltai TaxID=2609070 RepID=A0AAD9E3T2_9TELE|nr:hypothetical protein P4O66_022921 [Electrophorus voltai]
MVQYIKEALEQGYIHPSTSPASARVFLVKKDGGLRPCVDYQGLYKLLVQYPYPFPLVPAALEQLRGASLLARPLTNQLLGPTQRIKWTSEVEKAFEEMKTAFSTVLVLRQPEPERLFVVEVDAANIKAANPYPQCPPNCLYVPLNHRGPHHVGAYIFGDRTPWRYLHHTADQSVLFVAGNEQGGGDVASCTDCARKQFGPPEDIVSDRGSQFTSRVWKELLGKLNIMVSLTSGSHPQTNGQVERVNQELEQLAVERWCKESERTWEDAHQRLCKAIATYKKKVDRKWGETPQFVIRHKVWVSTKDSHAGATGKTMYESPYTINDQINEVSYRVGLTGSSRASQEFHVLAPKPVTEGPLAKEEAPSGDLLPPLEMEAGPVYRVQTLLDSQRRGRGLQYLVDWEGYGPEECSWVPASQILDPDLVIYSHRLHLLKPAPSQQGRSRSRSLAGSLGGRRRSVMVGRSPTESNTPTPDRGHTTNLPCSQSPAF